MITAVDTNVLLDVLIEDSPHGDASERALAESSRRGALVVSEPVVAEIAPSFASVADLAEFLDRTGLNAVASNDRALFLAGAAWRSYVSRRTAGLTCPSCASRQRLECRACGFRLAPRQHIIADFIIGAHAETHADGLLTRDKGYYGTYFPKLKLL